MNKKDKLWIKTMELFSKYWGCHQIPERSFFFKGYQFPVCARCTGMIIGYLSAFIITPFITLNIFVLPFLCVPLVIDGIVQYKTKYLSDNFKRIISGFLYGFGLIGTIIEFVKLILK